MFKTLQNALKMKELRGRLIFTFLMLLVNPFWFTVTSSGR
mgnify:CR=1 FL=1